MAWTTPKTWTTGEVLTAANMNAQVRDNLAYAAGTDRPHARVNNSGSLSISNSTTTVLTFDSERVDVGAMHSTSVNTGRLTIPSGAGGFWMVGGNVVWATNTTGRRELYIRSGGATLVAGDIRSASGDFPAASINQLCFLSAGDYVELVVSQNSGGALNVTATSAYSPEFWAIWMCV